MIRPCGKCVPFCNAVVCPTNQPRARFNPATDDAVDAYREEHGGWLPLYAAGRAAEARLARPVPGWTREELAHSQPCPSCGAPAHVACRGVVSPNAVHAWRLVAGAVR